SNPRSLHPLFKRASAREVSRSGLQLVALEQLAPDHHPLDLRGALADQQQRRIAVDPLDLVLLGVAVTAVDAQALLGTEAAGLRRKQLGHAGLDVRALPGVLHA